MIPTDPNAAQPSDPSAASVRLPDLVTTGGEPGSRGRDALKIDENALLVSDTRHPDHRLYRQAVDELHKLDPGKLGFKNEQDFMNAAAGLAEKAKAGGLHDIDHVVMSTNGGGVFAVQGGLDDERRHRVYADTDQLRAQPIEQTSYQMQQEALQQQRTQQEQQTQRQTVVLQNERDQRGPVIG